MSPIPLLSICVYSVPDQLLPSGLHDLDALLEDMRDARCICMLIIFIVHLLRFKLPHFLCICRADSGDNC
jgi:hypothetical protein